MRRARGFTLVELLVVLGVLLILIALLLPAARKGMESSRQVRCLDHLRQIGQATLMYCHENDDEFPGLCGFEPPLPHEWIYAESIYTAPFNDVTQSPIMRYLGHRDTSVLRCPSDDIASHNHVTHPDFGPYQYSYVINGWMTQWPAAWPTDGYKTNYGIWPAPHLRDVRNASQKILFLEGDPRFMDDGTYFIKIFLAPNDPNGPPFAEPPSFVHDVYRDMADPAQSSEGWKSRTNVVFCDGHGEFVTGEFIVPGIAHPSLNDPADRVHFDPHL